MNEITLFQEIFLSKHYLNNQTQLVFHGLSDEITQDQLANAEIMIEGDGMMKLSENYMFDHFTRSLEESFEMN